MEKVKVTREQAEAIERWADKIQLVKAKLFGFLNHGEDESIAEMTDDELIEALYIGYEVEPEFKVGDWVYNETLEKVAQVTHVYEKMLYVDDRDNPRFSQALSRKATPEEIAAEKERRWWAKHGRDVWELREGDILFDALYSVFQGVLRINGTEITWFDGDKASMDYVKERCKVVCFAENRLDGDFGEGD